MNKRESKQNKLAPEIINLIRTSKESCAKLADKFGISSSWACKIRNGLGGKRSQ
jgi:hypothetical protein